MLTPNTLHPTKLIAIGNSKGIRLPQALLRRYGLGDRIMLEERPEGLLLRGALSAKVSLKQTFAEMAQEQAAMAEDWSDLAAAEADGLDTLKW